MFKVLYMIMYYYINNNSHSVCGKSTKRDGAELRLFLGGKKKTGNHETMCMGLLHRLRKYFRIVVCIHENRSPPLPFCVFRTG